MLKEETLTLPDIVKQLDIDVSLATNFELLPKTLVNYEGLGLDGNSSLAEETKKMGNIKKTRLRNEIAQK